MIKRLMSMGRRGILYKGLSAGQCTARVADEMRSHSAGSRNMVGGAYDNYFYVTKLVKGRRGQVTEVTLGGNFEAHGEGTKIIYKMKNPFYFWSLIAPFIMAAAALLFAALDPYGGGGAGSIALVAVIGGVFAAIMLATSLYHDYTVIKFVKAMFNI